LALTFSISSALLTILFARANAERMVVCSILGVSLYDFEPRKTNERTCLGRNLDCG
jgi:hypothetical protein